MIFVQGITAPNLISKRVHPTSIFFFLNKISDNDSPAVASFYVTKKIGGGSGSVVFFKTEAERKERKIDCIHFDSEIFL